MGPAGLIQEQIEVVRAEQTADGTADRHAPDERRIEAEPLRVSRARGEAEEHAEHREDAERRDRTDRQRREVGQHEPPLPRPPRRLFRALR
jgi:hypothetical protein